LVLTEGFPNNPPKGFFSTKIFHPNVSASGEICVNTLKKDWKADVGIAQILLVRSFPSSVPRKKRYQCVTDVLLLRWVITIDNQVLTDCT
jgi:hypothetical protein